MTATQTRNTPACQVSDRIEVHCRGAATPGRINSVHSADNGVQHVARTDPADGEVQVLTEWTTSGQSTFPISGLVSGETR